MSLFTITTASGLTDRISAIVSTIETACITARTPSDGKDLYQRASQSNEYPVERDFITPTYDLENNLSGLAIYAQSNQLRNLIGAFDTHCQKEASVSFNTYLNNSGLQVSETFARTWTAVKGTSLTAHNVFSESTVTLATMTKVGSGNWTFTEGTALGSGGTSTYDTGNTGEQLLIAALPSGVSTSNCTMTLSGLDDAGNTRWLSFTFPNSVNNAHVVVSNTQKIRRVTNMTATTDTGISNSSVVTVVNKRERIITL